MSNQKKGEIHVDTPAPHLPGFSGISVRPPSRLRGLSRRKAGAAKKKSQERAELPSGPSSKTKTVFLSEIQAPSELTASEVEDFTLPYRTYNSIKGNSRAPEINNDDHIFQQKSPLGNTVLHIAAAYGNYDWVGLVVRKASVLLTAENSKGDMALHVAARAGHISILRELLPAHLPDHEAKSLPEAMKEILGKNEHGNTFIHEALLSGHEEVVMNFLSSKEDAPLPVAYEKMVVLAALFEKNEQNKSILYLAIEAGYKEVVEALIELTSRTSVNNLIEECPAFETVIPHNIDPDIPVGKSPLLAAILKRDKEILDLIRKKKPAWIKLKDTEGRTALHYAASLGYLDGVQSLLSAGASFAIVRDNFGFFPLHLASDGGHVEVVKKLLKREYCPDPRELIDNRGQNFLHRAAANGKFGVVSYILKAVDNGLGEMINDQDANGNTPLHLATLRCHPKIVRALTWDKRVKLMVVNGYNQTALDVCMKRTLEHTSFRQWLTWIALRSAGVKYADTHLGSKKFPNESMDTSRKQINPDLGPYKDRIDTLILVSTLIVTVTFAAGFTLPGGTNSSDPGQGMAQMLKRAWFHLFIFCITISMYSAIIVTIILFWAQVGDKSWAIVTVKLARLLLGVSLATLSLAFLTGVHLVISNLSWLATTFLVVCVIFTFILMLLYIGIWIPSSSSIPIVRYIYYYLFLYLASLVEALEADVK